MDVIGDIDAFVRADYQGKTYKTKVVRPDAQGSCKWNQVFKIPLQWPVTMDKLRVGVWDEDVGSKDEIVGTIILSLKEIKKACEDSKGGFFRWLNIYGAHQGLVEGPNMKEMNRNPEVASKWKGRVLMHLHIADSLTPERGVFEWVPSDKDKVGLKRYIEPKEYQIKFDVL